MIVDLLRNDLGRISRTGSVTWADVFQAERYETVWQLTTTVSSALEQRGPGGCVPGVVPQRIGHRRPQGPDDADHQANSRTPREASTAAPSATWRRPGRAPDARFNVAIRTVTVDTPRGRPSTAWAAASRGTPTPAPNTRRRSRRHASSPPVAPDSSSWRRCVTSSPRASGIWIGISRRLSESADYFGFRCDETEVGRRSRRRWRPCRRTVPGSAVPRQGRNDEGRVHGARERTGRRARRAR